MPSPDQIASLISEDIDISPQRLLQQYSQNRSIIRTAVFQRYCKQYDVTITEGELIDLMAANVELLFTEGVDKNGRYWSATISEGYDNYYADELPEIGDGDDLDGINSPSQEQDMMGQDLPVDRSVGSYEQEGDDPALMNLWKWINKADQIGLADQEDEYQEDDMMIAQDGDGADRDLDWDTHYRDTPDGNVMAPEDCDECPEDGPVLMGEVQIDEGGDKAVVAGIAKQVKGALGTTKAKEIFKWIMRKCEEYPEIRDQIITVTVQIIKEWFKSKDDKGAVTRGNQRARIREEKDLTEDKRTCQECGHSFSIPPRHFGQRSQNACPKCGSSGRNADRPIRGDDRRNITRDNPRARIREERDIMEGKYTCQECGHLFSIPDWATQQGAATCPKCSSPVTGQPMAAQPYQEVSTQDVVRGALDGVASRVNDLENRINQYADTQPQRHDQRTIRPPRGV